MLTDVVNRGDGSVIKKTFQRLHTHRSNIPGNKPFWTSSCFQFKAIAFHGSYMKKSPSLFQNDSVAEFYEYLY